MIIPNKLKNGSHIRVVAPARSLALISPDAIEDAKNKYAAMGVNISFGKNVYEKDEFISSSISSRVSDLHDAFQDKTVDAILTVIGGYNSNQLLAHLDYELIKENPKILCGFSDITTLSNAIYAKTGIVGYSGPHFSTLSMRLGIDYTIEYFLKCFLNEAPYKLAPSSHWSDDMWFLDQENRDFIENDGYWVLNKIEGVYSGTIIGGHLRCLNALQGTDYMPSLKDSILFIEEDEEISAPLFDRQLQSIIHQKDFSGVKAIVIGRFQKNSKISRDILQKIISTKSELKHIPIVANCDFGHTTPIITYPIGGTATLAVTMGKAEITINKH